MLTTLTNESIGMLEPERLVRWQAQRPAIDAQRTPGPCLGSVSALALFE